MVFTMLAGSSNTTKIYICVIYCLSCVKALEFLQKPVNGVALKGQPFWWNCHAVSASQIKYRWRFGEADLPSSDNQVIFSNGTLHFKKLTAADFGNYTCIAISAGQSIYSDKLILKKPYMADTVGVSPANVIVHTGNKANLHCEIKSLPPAKILWTHDKEIVKGGAIISMVTEMISSLSIPSASYLDQGEYRCIATNTLLKLSRQSVPVLVRVLGKPKILVAPESVEIPETHAASFNCAAAGNPTPVVLWYRQSPSSINIEIKTSDKYRVFPNGTLIVRSVTAKDVGFYTCLVRNQNGDDSRSVTLNITGPPAAPVLTTKPGDKVDALQDSNFTLKCIASGNPLPTITWTKEGGTIPESRASFSKPGTLKVVNVENEDRGVYICTATNVYGTVMDKTMVAITGGPRFLIQPQGVTVGLGASVVLQCQAAGDPPPLLTWITPKSGSLHAPSVEKDGITVASDGTLSIKSAERKHHGTYTCVATNRISNIKSAAVLNVEAPPKMLSQPVSQGAISGENITFTCQVEGFPTPKVTWFKDGVSGQLLNNNKYQIDPVGNLKIVGVTKDDVGTYNCSAENKLKQIYAFATLTVIVPPKFSPSLINKVVAVGGNTDLDCVTGGDPVPIRKWQRNGKTMIIDDNMNLLNNYTVLITGIRQSQLGKYTCVASNQAGERSLTVILQAGDFPYFTEKPVNTSVKLGGNVTVKCRAVAKEKPVITWTRTDAGGKIELKLIGTSTSDEPNSRVTVTENGDLFITKTVQNDEGWYVCAARNSKAGSVSELVRIDVQVLPKITSTNTPQTVASQQTAYLSCDASGDPSPTFSWKSPKGVLIGSNTPGYQVDVANKRLIIGAVKIEIDGGDWTCSACNPAGCDEAVVRLLVVGKPLIENVEATKTPMAVSVLCKSMGLPTPTIVYFAGEKKVDSTTPGHSVMNNTLTITVSNIGKQYKCVAENTHGSDTRVLTEPGSPSKLSVTNIKSNEVTLSWEDGNNLGNLPVLMYKIEYRMAQAEKWMNVNESISGRSFTLKKLKPYSSYFIRVGIVNVLGSGPFSGASNFKTLATAPSAPQNLTAIPDALKKKILVTWAAPQDINGEIDDVIYAIGLILSSTAADVLLKVVKIKSNETLQVQFDASNGQYAVRLAAINTAISQSSKVVEVFVKVTDPVPKFVPEILDIVALGPYSIMINWTIPTNTTLFPPVEGYLVFHSVADQEDGDKQQKLEGMMHNNTTLTDLKERATYNVKVTAYNSGGHGPFSKSKKITTKYELFSSEAYKKSIFLTKGATIAIIAGCLAAALLILILIFICVQHQRLKRMESVSFVKPSHALDRFYIENPNFSRSLYPSRKRQRLFRSGKGNYDLSDNTAYENLGYDGGGDSQTSVQFLRSSYLHDSRNVNSRGTDPRSSVVFSQLNPVYEVIDRPKENSFTKTEISILEDYKMDNTFQNKTFSVADSGVGCDVPSSIAESETVEDNFVLQPVSIQQNSGLEGQGLSAHDTDIQSGITPGSDRDLDDQSSEDSALINTRVKHLKDLFKPPENVMPLNIQNSSDELNSSAKDKKSKRVISLGHMSPSKHPVKPSNPDDCLNQSRLHGHEHLEMTEIDSSLPSPLSDISSSAAMY